MSVRIAEIENPASGWVREPLVHFLLAGLVIFAVSAWRGEAVDPASRTIIVDEAKVTRLAAVWEQTWQRPPTATEIDGLIKDYIKEEIYYREARRMGLDEDDAVIRRRLRAKMEFLAGAEVESAQPSDATLQAWLDRNPARYAADAAYSFDQIYLGSPGPAAAETQTKLLKATLAGGADWRAQGETLSLPQSLEVTDKTAIARDFGDDFARALAGVTPGGWTGPIASGFGQHLVRVRAVKRAAPPQLAEVRQAVENDWRAATLQAHEAKGYQLLLDAYTIEIAEP